MGSKTASPKVGDDKVSSPGLSNLKLSFRLPKLDHEGKAASKEVPSPNMPVARSRSNSLLITPTVSPLKLVERSRSQLSVESPVPSPVTSPDSRRPIQQTRRPSNANVAVRLTDSGDDCLERDPSTRYPHPTQGSIVDVLMEWDYQKKTYVLS